MPRAKGCTVTALLSHVAVRDFMYMASEPIGTLNPVEAIKMFRMADHSSKFRRNPTRNSGKSGKKMESQ